MTYPAHPLTERLLTFIDDQGKLLIHGKEQDTDSDFNNLALALFAYQFEKQPVYQQYCLHHERTPENVRHWRDIPPMPIRSFRQFTLSCIPPQQCEAMFMSSGTTEAQRGKHYMADLRLYHASGCEGFEAFVLPDGAQLPILVLFPHPEEMPNSSLAHFLDLLARRFGAEGSRHYVKGNTLDTEGLNIDLRHFSEANQPVLIIGASFSFVHWYDHLQEQGVRFTLPAGSRLIDTGGFKGRTREVSSDQMRTLAVNLLGLAETHVLNYYGMCELASQHYDSTLREALLGRDVGLRRKLSPPWTRVRVVDPLTLRDVAPGETGVIVHYDLANQNSLFAIRTEDMGTYDQDGFQVLGRVPRSEARGCSIAIDMVLTGDDSAQVAIEAPATTYDVTASSYYSESEQATDKRIGSYWLPSIGEAQHWQRIPSGPEAWCLAVPKLSPDALATVLDDLASARSYLDGLTTEEIAARIDAAASLWDGSESPYRQRALRYVPEITRYPVSQVEAALDDALAQMRSGYILNLVEDELGSVDYLDRFAPSRVGKARAFGPRITFAIFAGNVPGVPLPHLAHALVLRSALIGKVARGEPYLPALFARSLHEIDPHLARCLALTWWPGGDEALESLLYARSDAVIAYGSDATVDAVRRRVRSDARFMGYGHRYSFAVVAHEFIKEPPQEVLAGLAQDMNHLEQQGCVSPQMLWIEASEGHESRLFAERLLATLEATSATLPQPQLDLAGKADIARAKDHAELQQIAGASIEVVTQRGGRWTIFLNREEPEGPMAPPAGLLGHTVWVQCVSSLDKIPHALDVPRQWLQTIGLAVPEHRVGELSRCYGAWGATRMCSVGKMQWPSPYWHHDGRPLLSDLVRWVNIEG